MILEFNPYVAVAVNALVTTITALVANTFHEVLLKPKIRKFAKKINRAFKRKKKK